MRVGIVTPVWGRFSVTAFYWAGVLRLLEDPGINFSVYIVGDQDIHRVLASFATASWINAPNYPVSEKWERGIQTALDDGCDYVWLLGSDNWITPALAASARNAMTMGAQYFGTMEGYLVDAPTRRVLYCHGHTKPERRGEPIGILRGIKSSVLEDFYYRGYRLWPKSMSKSLDHAAHVSLLQVVDRCVELPLTDDAYGLDIKSDISISSYERLQKHYPEVELDPTEHMNTFERRQYSLLSFRQELADMHL